MNPLAQEINRWLGLPFIWGQTDCCLVLVDWVRRARGLEYDPAEHLRYCYNSLTECHRLTGFLRDPIAVLDDVLGTRAGLERTDTPRRGDVGLVLSPAEENPIGAIFTGTSWVSKAPQGMTSFQPRAVLAAWSVGYED